jgi:hypothetical protein
MAVLNKLASLPQVDSSQLASIGFRMSGTSSLGERAAARSRRLSRRPTSRTTRAGQVKAKGWVVTGEATIRRCPSIPGTSFRPKVVERDDVLQGNLCAAVRNLSR